MDECRKKGRKYFRSYLRIISAGAMALIVVFAATAVSASAVEVPRGVTEVKIPISLEAAASIAGAEISFTKTAGLKYLRYEPAKGLEHPVKADAGGKTWVGFFSASNKYKPTAGKIDMGNLVFSYAGEATEHVNVADVKLHSLTAPENVESKKSEPDIDIPVTRQGASSGGGKTETPGGGVVVNPGDGSGGVVTPKPGGGSGGNGNGGGSGSGNSSGGKGVGKGGEVGSSLSPDKDSSGGGKSKGSGNNSSGGAGSGAGSGGVPASNTGNAANSAGAQTADAGTGAGGTSLTTTGSAADTGGTVASAADESGMVPFTNDESLKGISDDGSPFANSQGQDGVNWFLLFIIAIIGMGFLLLLAGKRWREDKRKSN